MMYINNNQYQMDTTHLMYSQLKIRLINQRKQKYRRSTNNSHKKFICVARKLLFKYCTYRQRELFQNHYEPYQNSRVFYFIILSHPKIRMSHNQKENFRKNLITLLQAKIQTYNEQIRNTNNKNFINFRFEEIADIQFAINALNLYFENKVEQAIEAIYKKEKGFILKKQQYQMAIQTVHQLQSKLKSYPQGQMFPYLAQKPIPEQMEKISNKYKSKEEQDEEWVLQKRHRQATKRSARRDRTDKTKQDIGQAMLDTNCPLLFLQNSYAYNPNFYNILFNHSADPLIQPSYLHSLDPIHMSRANEEMHTYVPPPPQRQSLPNYQQLHQQHVMDHNYSLIRQTVKRQQIAEMDYYGIVKSEFKDKDMLIPPTTTKEYDPSLN